MMNHEINGIFPSPVYSAKRETELTASEMEDIKNIIEKGKLERVHTTEALLEKRTKISDDSYIFDTKLYKLKEFCEQHIKIYVKEILNPKEELDFYIQQSWLTVTSPGENIPAHHHSNSILSGTFYVSTAEDDKVHFYDFSQNLKTRIEIEVKEYNLWNSHNWYFSIEDNDLILFPSWLDHGVEPNKKSYQR